MRTIRERANLCAWAAVVWFAVSSVGTAGGVRTFTKAGARCSLTVPDGWKADTSDKSRIVRLRAPDGFSELVVSVKETQSQTVAQMFARKTMQILSERKNIEMLKQGALGPTAVQRAGADMGLDARFLYRFEGKTYLLRQVLLSRGPRVYDLLLQTRPGVDKAVEQAADQAVASFRIVELTQAAAAKKAPEARTASAPGKRFISQSAQCSLLVPEGWKADTSDKEYVVELKALDEQSEFTVSVKRTRSKTHAQTSIDETMKRVAAGKDLELLKQEALPRETVQSAGADTGCHAWMLLRKGKNALLMRVVFFTKGGRVYRLHLLTLRRSDKAIRQLCDRLVASFRIMGRPTLAKRAAPHPSRPARIKTATVGAARAAHAPKARHESTFFAEYSAKLSKVKLTKGVVAGVPKGLSKLRSAIRAEPAQDVPPLPQGKGTSVGQPVAISAGPPQRFDEFVALTFAFDANALPPRITDEAIGVLHFDGRRWDFIPGLVDRRQRTVTIHTLHLSSFLAFGRSPQEEVKQWIKGQALKKAQAELADIKGKIKDRLQNTAMDYLGKLKGLGKSAKLKILRKILESKDSIASLSQILGRGDVQSFNKDLSVLVGKSIVDHAPPGKLKSILQGLVGDISLPATLGKAAGAAAGGDYWQAVEVLGKAYSTTTPVYQAATKAIDAVNFSIYLWKNQEMQNAYEAWKNGAPRRYWGLGQPIEARNIDSVAQGFAGVLRWVKIENERAGHPMTNAAILRQLEGIFKSREKQEEIARRNEEQLNRLHEIFTDERQPWKRRVQERSGLQTDKDNFQHFVRLVQTVQGHMAARGARLERSLTAALPEGVGELLLIFLTKGATAYKEALNAKFGPLLPREFKV